MKALAIAIVIAAAILGVAYVQGEETKTKRAVATECLKAGGSVAWGWGSRPTCEARR